MRVPKRRRARDRQPAVHRANVERDRLRQAHGEPEAEYSRETTRDPVASHDSNVLQLSIHWRGQPAGGISRNCLTTLSGCGVRPQPGSERRDTVAYASPSASNFNAHSIEQRWNVVPECSRVCGALDFSIVIPQTGSITSSLEAMVGVAGGGVTAGGYQGRI